MTTTNTNVGTSNSAAATGATTSSSYSIGYSGINTITVNGGGGGGGNGIASTNFIQNSMGSTNGSTFTYTYPSMNVNKLVVDGIDISNFIQNIASRLAILDAPSPEKLEQFNALRKAYENYKLLEQLFNDDSKGKE